MDRWPGLLIAVVIVRRRRAGSWCARGGAARRRDERLASYPLPPPLGARRARDRGALRRDHPHRRAARAARRRGSRLPRARRVDGGAATGIVLGSPGEPRVFLPADRIVGVGQATCAIDRGVEPDGLVRVTLDALGDAGRPARRHLPRARTRTTRRASSPPSTTSPPLDRVATGTDERRPPMTETPSAARTDPAVLVLEDGTRYDGRAYGARGRTLGEAVFATGMTGYQETLTDPSLRRPDRLMTAPHIGNTGMNDEDPESAPHLGRRATSCATPPASSRTSAPTRSLDDDLVGDGIVGHQRHRHPRGHPPHPLGRQPCAAGIFSGGCRALTADEQLDARARRRRDGRAEPLGRGLGRPPRPYTLPAEGERIGILAVLDLGVKQSTIDNLAARGFDVHVLPQDVTLEELLRDRARSRCSTRTAPATRRHPTTTSSCCAACCDDGLPFFGICFGNQLLGRALGLRHLQAAVRAPRHQPAGARQGHRPRRDHRRTTTASPSTRRSRASVRQPERLRPGRGEPRRPQRQRRRGAARPRHPGVLGAVPPRGRRRPARRQLPVRPVPRHGHREHRRPAPDAQARRHHTASSSSAPARS